MALISAGECRLRGRGTETSASMRAGLAENCGAGESAQLVFRRAEHEIQELSKRRLELVVWTHLGRAKLVAQELDEDRRVLVGQRHAHVQPGA